MSDISRRTVFQIIGAAPAVAALAHGEDHSHMHMAAAAPMASGPYKRQTFDDHQWKTIHVVCDLIIPADDHGASASQAGVPEFLDDWIAFKKQYPDERHEVRHGRDDSLDLTAMIFGGLMWLDRVANESAGTNFVDLSEDQQKKILDRVAYPEKAALEDAPFVPFFNQIRGLTIEGFFSSKAGVEYLPYLGNVAVEEWKGCDPKVWAIIEDRQKNGYKGLVNSES